MDEQNLNRTFARYMSLNILGMLGMSGYILADTFFVSSRLGSDGLAALNLAISVFGFINGLGMMLGIGGATRYAICKAREDDREANASFTLSLVAGIGAGVVLVLFGLLFSRPLAGLLGAEDRILPMCAVYLRTAFLFAPFFILNHILVAFVRNDGSPKLAMTAMLVGSLSNIVLDYLFLYPLNMGIFGAALATGTAPIIGIAISSIHIFSGRSQFKAVPTGLSLRKMAAVAGLGIAAFINEFSSGITLVVFNLLVMHAAGTIGVAAYGVVANLALVVLSVFTGIAQGSQPLLSYAYGMQDLSVVRRVYHMALLLASALGLLALGAALLFPTQLVSLFNSEGNAALQAIAEPGLKLYFIGFLFVGFNFVSAALLGATEQAGASFRVSFFRGCLGIVPAACLFAFLFGMTGIWLAFPAVELVTLFLSVRLGRRALAGVALPGGEAMAI
ncbi:MATE efflux family protein [Pseudoflavonifractor capillosus ATCC 29799]|uniref:Probable multidrug resistance protein NorM n=1 Tax=Pseudoflavonifractor capillosus ATCC 29799 TaxID=411467 RepID=A6NVX4_9FIRM|nr:MATE family efflux transporter [Pseudoflavonifractor capillosus]EDM99631.1 MATE efflux family protein [Pseudoflavonifractor capillosus ATCC 29799]